MIILVSVISHLLFLIKNPISATWKSSYINVIQLFYDLYLHRKFSADIFICMFKYKISLQGHLLITVHYMSKILWKKIGSNNDNALPLRMKAIITEYITHAVELLLSNF